MLIKYSLDLLHMVLPPYTMPPSSCRLYPPTDSGGRCYCQLMINGSASHLHYSPPPPPCQPPTHYFIVQKASTAGPPSNLSRLRKTKPSVLLLLPASAPISFVSSKPASSSTSCLCKGRRGASIN